MELEGDERRKKQREKMRKNEKKGEHQRQEREKTNKIINASATVTVYICTVIVAIVHKCTILHPLMWVFFGSKCVE